MSLQEVSLADLYSKSKEDLVVLFSAYAADELKLFAANNEIPYPKGISRPKLAYLLANEINLTGIYRRIAGSDKKEQG